MMLNSEEYTIKLDRLDACRLATACLSLQFDFEKEGDGHKGTVEMYKRIREMICKQIDEQDAERGF